MAATLLDVEAVRSRFSSLRDGGFVFLDAPGGSQVPDEVGDAIARTLREASAQHRRDLRDEQARRADPRDRARRRGPLPRLLVRRRDLRDEHDVARLRALAHRGARLEGGRPDPRLAPRPRRRRRAVDRARGRPRLRGRVGERDGGSAPRLRRPREPARRARARRRVRRIVERDRDDRRRRARVGAGARGRRAVLGRRRAVRRARADRRAGARLRRLHRVRVQVLRPAPRRRVRPARAARVVASVQGASGRVGAGRPPLRGRDGAVRAPRRLLRDARVPRVDRRDGGDRRLRARARPALPRRPAGRRDRLRAADDGRPRPHVPDQSRRRRRRRSGEAALATRASACGRTTTGTRSGCGRSSRTPDSAIRVGLIHYNTADEIDRFNAALAAL